MQVRSAVHLAGGDLVKQAAQQAFPARQHVGQIGDDHPFQIGSIDGFLDITIIGIRADRRLHAGILDHVDYFMGGVNGGYRYQDRADFLDTQEGDHPLGAIGDIDHHPVALGYSQGP